MNLLFKIVLAVAGVAAIAVVAGADMFPAVSRWQVLLFAGACALGGLPLVGLLALVGQKWHRFGLNHGATDPGWMWFGGEPPGLQAERRRAENHEGASAPR